jgi:hypothetical protein
MMGEYGRAVRFYWQDTERKLYGDECNITVGTFTGGKTYTMRLGHLRNALKAIDGEQTMPPFTEKGAKGK